MSDASLRALIAAATAYDELFVPALFQQWAGPVLTTAGVRPGHRVLDVACGTGALAREAAARVGPGGAVTGLDPGPGMLAVAAQHAPAIAWRQGVAESRPFADRSFDAVVSQFGLMFFTDRHQALREMLRVLKPRGRLAIAVWDSLDHTPAYAAEVALLERVAGRPAADALRAPFVLGDGSALVALLENAGATSITIKTRKGTGRFPSIRTMVEADLRGWLPVVGVELTEDVIQRTLVAAAEDLAEYVTAAGTVEFELPAHIVAATAP